jgi:hypothetical protein
MNLEEIVEQLESCNYECEGGSLKNNVAFIKLKKMVGRGESGSGLMICPLHLTCLDPCSHGKPHSVNSSCDHTGEDCSKCVGYHDE